MPSLDEVAAVLRAGVRPVPGWPGYYATRDGRILSARAGVRILTPSPHHRTGHLRVKLYRGDHDQARSFYVHRLVCLAWHGPPPGEGTTHPEDVPRAWMVLHADHDAQNNAPDNLAWGTRLDNGADLSRGMAAARAASGIFGGDEWLAHEAAQAAAGRLGVYVPDPRWGF